MPTPEPIATSTIVTQAFRLMEKSPISSFADDSEEASAAAEQYPVAMEMCLEACDWSFASFVRSLSELSALPQNVPAEPDLPYAYALPGNLVHVQECGTTGTNWRVDAELLRADQAGPLRIRYTGSVDNEANLPAIFRTAVAYTLAALLAPRWVGTRTKIADLNDMAATMLKRAMARDRNQASPSRYDGQPDSGDWATGARL